MCEREREKEKISRVRAKDTAMSTFVIHEQINHGKVNSCVKEDKTEFNTLRQANVNTQVASKNISEK